MSEATIPVSPWKRKRRPVFTEDVPLPGLGVTVRLRNLDALLTSEAEGEIAALTEEYCGDDAQPYVADDGEGGEETIPLNEFLIRDLCYLRAMQAAEKRLEFGWWLGVTLRCEAEYLLLAAAAKRVTAAAKRDPGNSPGAHGSGS